MPFLPAFRTLSRSVPLRTIGLRSCRSLSSSSRNLIQCSPLLNSSSKEKLESQTYSESQTSKPLNPHLTNTTSTLRADSHVPSVGVHPSPPEFLSSVDGNFNPKDTASPENTSRITGGTQDGLGKGSISTGTNEKRPSFTTDEEVISMLEGKFKIEPLRRHGEDLATMRSRLQYQSRKRGILETDLLLSTFADVNLHNMTKEQLTEYDLFLDENDWDIYYWATQTPPSTSREYAEGSGGSSDLVSDAAHGVDITEKKSVNDFGEATGAIDGGGGEVEVDKPKYGQGEWAQTVGKKKEPYRVPPPRWRDSSILKLIRKHVHDRKASGDGIKGVEGTNGGEGGGLGRMPNVKSF